MGRISELYKAKGLSIPSANGTSAGNSTLIKGTGAPAALPTLETLPMSGTSAQKLQSAARSMSGTLPVVAETERALAQYALSAQSAAATNQRDLSQIKSELEAARSAEKSAMNRLNDYMLTYSGALDLRDPAELQALKDNATAATKAREQLEQEYNAHEGSFEDQFGEYSGVEKAAMGIIGSPFAAVDVIAQTAKSAIGGDNTMDMDTLAMQNYKKTQQLKASATENLSGAGKFLADTGISIAQNLYALPMNVVMPGGSLAVMGTTAAADKMAELGDQGESATRALVRGAISGGIEAATEKIPLDSLADLVKTGGKGVIKNLLKQGGVEATEEGVAYAANYIADKLAKDPNATWDWADFADSVASGGVSGLFFGLGGTAVNQVSNSSINSNGIFLPGSGLESPVQTQQTTQTATTAPTQPAMVQNAAAQTQGTTAQNAAPGAAQAQKNTAPIVETAGTNRTINEARVDEIYDELAKGKRKVDGYTVYINRDSQSDGATITVKQPDGSNVKKRIDGGRYYTNEQLRYSAATLVAELAQDADFKNAQAQKNTAPTGEKVENAAGVVDKNRAVIYKNNKAPAAASDGTSTLAGDLDTVADTGTDQIIPQETQEVNGRETQQGVELPVVERRAVEEPPMMTGGMNNGEQLQRTETGDRAADGGAATAGRTADSGKVEANLSDRGRGRISDKSTGGEAGVLADSPEGARRSTADQGRAAIERQNLAKTLRGEKVSSRSLGIKQGTETPNLTVVPENIWDDGMQGTAERVRNETGQQVTYVLGRIQLEGRDGELHHVRGVYSKDGIILQADNMRLSTDQIADHEIFHSKSAQSPGLISQIEERITERYGREELDKAIDTYIRKLRGVIDIPENATQFEMDDAMQDVLEEIFADAYAGINAFSAHAEQFNETVERTLDERGIGRGTQAGAATERTTGPLERYSTDEDQEKKPKKKPVAESKPIIAKSDLRKNMMGLFSIPEGQKLELGKVVDQFADRLLKNGTLTEEDRSAFFDRMYQAGVVNVPADEYYQAGREIVKGGKVYVNEQVRAEFGDDWGEFRKRAFGAGVYLTGNQADSGIDVWNTELSEMLPGLFNASDTDSRDILERIVQIAEEGKDEKVSLAEYTAMLAEQEYIPEDEFLDNMERQMDWALRTFAEKAELEIKLRDRTGIKLAQEREQRREAMQRQREDRELRELQQRTLKQLQWLSKNRYKAPQELKAAWDEVLGDIDIYAVNAANEMNWSKKYQATWRDLHDMYLKAKAEDPNFFELKELERIVTRLDAEKIGDMDIGALQDLYKAAVGIRTAFYNRNNVINDEMNRMFSEVYTDAKQEIETAPGRYTGKMVDHFVNREQLTPMNMLERMGGWNPDGAFYSMARQLEKGERDVRDYTVRAKRHLQGFLEENADWVKKADGQGKDAVWYELEVPELLELHMGDKPIFGKTVKVYMTPAQKVHLYLESKSEDNLRHMMGGRTFVNKELYSKGKRSEALAQGTTVKLAPETVKKIVSDLTEEELALAQALDSYYNGFAHERINKISNALYGFDKAVSKNYAPIYTDESYNGTTFGVFDTKAENVGRLKGRIPHSKNPSYNISALDAFERHVDQTARFVGMAIPTRNWEHLMDYHGKNTTMKKIISDKWGKEANKFIENLITELQGGKTTEERSTAEKIMDTALSNYISSVFGFNPSIVFKQAMSFPLAGTYLGWENMPNIQKALATDEGLINTYTSELAYRLMGYSTPETAQLKNNPSKLDQNKALNFTFRGGAITAMDGWTVKTIWRWAENAVKRTSPDLEVGTQEQINAGQSPFYRAVAKEFEEAVSRSQPMYDIMHRSQIMRTSNKAVRALTLFKTVPQQQYNMLRQVEGEAKHYKREYQNGNVTKEEYTQAKKKVGRAALGVIAAGFGIEAINFLNALLKNRAKRYQDDEGELTWASGWRQFLEGFTSDNLGMIIGGDLTVEILGSVILGDNWYGIETPGITQIEDVFEKFISGCQTIQGLVQDGYKVLSNGGDLGEYFRRHGADYLGALDEALSTVLTYFGGVAANNIKSYALGVLSWMSPQLATAYEDLLATADKSGLAGLTGEALETRVRDILKNRLGSADDETAAALAGLYEAGYETAIPTDAPDKVTVNSEEKKLNAYQQQFYDTVWRESIGDSLDELVSSDTFQGAGEETQAKMTAKLYSYAAEKAKAALFEDYETDSWVEDADAAVQDGDTLAEWIAWRALSTGVTTNFEKIADAGLSKEEALDIAQKIRELEPLEGKTTVSSLQKYRAVIDTGLTEKEQMAALSSLMGESEYLKLQTGYSFGVTPETYVFCKESLPQYDADGNGSYKQEEVRAAIDALNGLSTDQKAALWQIQSKSWKPANNPYSKSVGQQVYDALSAEAEESAPQELPNRDWSAVIGLPSLVD